METAEAVIRHYETRDEGARLVSKRGQVEFLTTMRYIERHLAPGARILELGAGTGRYSHALAAMGFEVDAVELSPRHCERFRADTRPGERVRLFEGNALDLSRFPDGQYDLTLSLGPMYHLFSEADRARALSEACRVTRPGGVLFIAYLMADATLLTRAFKGGYVREYVAAGMIDPVTFRTHSTPREVFCLSHREDIDRAYATLPLRRLHFVAADGYCGHMPEAVDAMDEETFQLYLRYHFLTCERPDMAGVTHHALDVLRRE